MKKIRMLTCLITAALVAVSFAGCGESAAKTVDVSKQQGQEQGKPAPQQERGVIAKVVSLDGDQLTVILADMPDNDRNGQPPANGVGPDNGMAAPNSKNERPPASGPAIDGSAAPASGPAIDSSAALASGPAVDGGSRQSQPDQPGRRGGKFTFTGEKVTYTLSSEVAIVKGMGENAEEMDLSKLAADDVIRFTTITDDSGVKMIDTIVVME